MNMRDILLARAMGGGSGSGGSGSGGASIDVTASVGQTIVVEEVDANVKPTKWKAAEYQPRTHWSEETVILPETTGVYSEDDSSFYIPFVELVGGTRYKIVYNGVEYISDCMDFREDGIGEILLGNVPLLEETGDNGLPFVCVMATDGVDGMGAVAPLDGAESVTISITEVAYTPIPVEYVTNAFPYYIEVTGSGTDDDPYVCNDTVANVEAAYTSGRSIALKRKGFADVNQSVYQTNMYLLSTVLERRGDGNSVSPFGLTFAFTFVANPTASSNSFTSNGLWLYPWNDGTYRVSNTMGG